MTNRLFVLVPLIAALPAPHALAQWSGNPAVNLAIGDKTGEQNQAKIAATTGGGVYISWFDNSAGGYDVYLQRLSAGGVEQFPHNGVLVADRSFSSTQDYGLAVDGAGNALLAYRDDRAGGTQVGCNMVAPDGTLLWGPLGRVLTGTTDFIASPHVCATSDGFVVVAWTQGSGTMVQKLDSGGNPVWASPVAITPASGSYTATDVIPGDNGSVIVGLVKGTQRNLHAQKIKSDGTVGWAAPLVVFDGSAVQFGYFPAPKPDGTGGAVFAWYETGGTRNVYAQHVSAAGAEVFPHNGVAVSTDTGLIRLSPDFAYDGLSGDLYVCWTDTNQGQSQWGLSGQKISATGQRAWGDQPAAILPLSGNQNAFVRACLTPAGPAVFCFDRAGNAQVIGFGLNPATGAQAWSTTVCSVLSGKARLAACAAGGGSRLAWGDARTDQNDIYAQNVNADGTLGAASCYPDCNGDGALNLSDFGCFQTKFALGDPYADCNGDGVLNLADFGCFTTKFALGCP
ncbi:MAG: EF-hand domain-containing protein [Phycisphaerales bacterium]|nr:EF-hand domain-containing protein [Phycisphaerales bacterium]